MSPSSTVHQAESMRMEIVGLDPGETAELETAPGDEAAVLLVSGGIEAGEDTASRESAFDPPLAGWYLPPGESWSGRATSPAILATVMTEGADLKPTGGDLAFTEAAEGEKRGRGEWERTVTTLINPGAVGSQRLIAGQTTHADGGWSSYPPHRHDGSGDEPYFEEIYHYRFDPPTGIGFQGFYGDGLNEARLIRDGETLTISRGYHPVCAAPRHRFTYFWALCGPAERFEQVDDPDFAWVSGS